MKIAVAAVSAVVTILMTNSAYAIDDTLPIWWDKGITKGHTYLVSVTDRKNRRMAGPYEFTVQNRTSNFGIRSSSQSRRDTMVCVEPTQGAKPLTVGFLKLGKKRTIRLEADSKGRICTPQNFSIDAPEVRRLELRAR